MDADREILEADQKMLAPAFKVGNGLVGKDVGIQRAVVAACRDHCVAFKLLHLFF